LKPVGAGIGQVSSGASEDDRYDSILTTKMNAQQKNDFGERLYAQIAPAWDAVSIATVKEVGMWTEGITAGKMTGMALEAYTARELETMLADPRLVAEHMAKCVEAIWQHAEKTRVAEAAAVAAAEERKAQKKHEHRVQKQERWVQKNARLRDL
jgi:hypothetical protein